MRRYLDTIGLLIVPLILVLCVTSAFGQLAGKGTIVGTVTDSTGAVVPGATVTATNVATNGKMVREASEAGTYSMPLDPGVYTITVAAKGFKATSQSNVNVNGLETISVNITLTVGSATETVEVTGSVDQLDTATAQVTATMEQEVYSALPVTQNGTQRRATDFVQYMPGVNAQPTNGGLDTNTGVVNGSGSRGAVASVYIEGMPIMTVAGQGDPRFIWTSMPVEAINQFQVTTVGYPATYEGQGVLNYDIKRGTNSIHGSVYEFFRNSALDTWGYMAPWSNNPLTGKPSKPQEHQNEYGFSGGAPIIKDKLFVFGSFEGYKLRSAPNLQSQTNPTTDMMNGNFSAFLAKNPVTGVYDVPTIFDPASTTCTATVCTRTPFAGNIIPLARLTNQAKYLQSFLPPPTTTGINNNYIGGLPTGRNNWMTANRVDYNLTSKQTVSAIISLGKQGTLGGAGTGGNGITGPLTATQNQAPDPYGSSQDFVVQTRVVILEHTYVFNPHVINQVKLAWGRYNSTGTSRSIGSDWSATAAGITGLPAGQAQDSFPTVTFAGNGTQLNRWAGYSSNRNVSNGTIFTDNVQWEKGKHSLTIGGQVAAMEYNYLNNATGVNPLQLTFNSAETAGFAAGKNTTDTTLGNAYASFLLGAVNQGTFTVSSAPETGARFRAISPYVQDNWKVNSKLTLNLGLRWDMYPSYRETQDRLSWMDPTAINPLVGVPGAMVYGGFGTGTCNCKTNVKDYYKNFGPRLGFAYALFPKTVIRGSWGVMYTHGNNVGGSATSRQSSGLLGYAASPKTTSTNPVVGQTGTVLWNLGSAFNATYTNPPTLDPTLGTYYTTASSAASQTVSYADPYYGGRAPEYINWSFGIQHQLSKSMTATVTYVGSEGHFTYSDATTARGIYSNQLDPKWLYLAGQLGNKATAANLLAAGITAPFSTFSSSTGTITQALRPFPQYNGVTDALGYVGNTNYNALEAILQRRMSKGLTLMATYTYSRSIDNNGTFRSGYDIPAAYSIDGQFHSARSLDKSVSLSDIPHRVVVTSVYDLPFGKGNLGGGNRLVRAVAGGWKLSGIFFAQSGTPLGLTMQNCPTNPSAAVCQPFLNSNFTGNIMALGGYEHVPALQLGTTSYFNHDAFAATPGGDLLSYNYMFSTLARTAPLGLRNSGDYRVDASLRRAIRLNERFKLNFTIDSYNLTNHTRIGFANSGAILSVPTKVYVPATGTTAASGTPFGTPGIMNTSRYFQLSARVEF
jgi:hypothetical protein